MFCVFFCVFLYFCVLLGPKIFYVCFACASFAPKKFTQPSFLTQLISNWAHF